MSLDLHKEYHALFLANFETGELLWRPRVPGQTILGKKICKRSAAVFNSNSANQPALTCKNSDGYMTGRAVGQHLYAHRVLFCMKYGFDPDHIDHKNGVTSDNRHSNLRSAGRKKNQKNLKKRSDNTSGVLGVSWDKRRNNWRANIRSNGKQIHLGNFQSFEDAVSARENANQKYGYYKNHGR